MRTRTNCFQCIRLLTRLQWYGSMHRSCIEKSIFFVTKVQWPYDCHMEIILSFVCSSVVIYRKMTVFTEYLYARIFFRYNFPYLRKNIRITVKMFIIHIVLRSLPSHFCLHCFGETSESSRWTFSQTIYLFILNISWLGLYHNKIYFSVVKRSNLF